MLIIREKVMFGTTVGPSKNGLFRKAKKIYK